MSLPFSAFSAFSAPPRAAAADEAEHQAECREHAFTMEPMPETALDTAIHQRDARRFCEEILPRVSRTFALGIRVLPGDLGRAVLTAYLICRIADTVEDAPDTRPEVKGPLLDELVRCFDDAAVADAYPARVGAIAGEPAHVTLVRHTDLVFAHFRTLPPRTQALVRRWVEEMAMGMKKFVFLYPDGIRIQTLDEYREYCYYVAGTVGYLLTDLWHEHSPSIGAERYAVLRERCRAFAEALQTVNILKDVAHDAERENSIYVPEQLLREHGSGHTTLLAADHLSHNRSAIAKLVQLAWADLEEARAYLLLIPRRAVAIRLFCMLPLLFAYATLRDLARSSAQLVPGGTVKISRREVKSLLMTACVIVGSNGAVRWLVERVRTRAFVLGRA